MYGNRRMCVRDRLDRDPDCVVIGGKISFRQTFETVEAAETFCRAPADVIDAGRRLLTLDIATGLSTLVHNTIVVKIGCNNIPLFAMVFGGRGRALFSLNVSTLDALRSWTSACCRMSTSSSGSSWGFLTVTGFQRFLIASRGTRSQRKQRRPFVKWHSKTNQAPR